ncbi:hypothetical protein S7711_07469 [Stachybotrys chartarum IBT 7711]|uniref:Uncharacterized protein n=1 Tax=Stachybotrys chartarum (strain CBS 109288 / IBT 7711) TaxID=1280523 RepID=A0A084AFP5_STACB|nr:hypothetical protein S7711_07469 [Stachybotrys chartarum IBT 7711]
MLLHAGATHHKQEHHRRRPSVLPFLYPVLPAGFAGRSRAPGTTSVDSQPLPESATRGSYLSSEPASVALPAHPPHHKRHRGPSPASHDQHVTFALPDTASAGSVPKAFDVGDGGKHPILAETGSSTNLDMPPRRRTKPRRQVTRFSIARPPPGLRSKQRMVIQLRPRLLLQLQKLGDKRALPTFDVVPSSVLAGSLIIPMLAKKFPRIVHAKPDLDQKDLLIVHSDDYDLPPPGTSHTDNGPVDANHQDFIAIIRPRPQHGNGCAEIVVEGGSVWSAAMLDNGSFEFSTVDSSGRSKTARWVQRRSLSMGRDGSTSGTTSSSGFTWAFSILDPSATRHPVLGTLDHETLELFETYYVKSGISEHREPSSLDALVNQAALSSNPKPILRREASEQSKDIVAVEEKHKQLMVITSVWISMWQAGWPESAEPKLARALSACRSTSNGGIRRHRNRTESVNGPTSTTATAASALSDTKYPVKDESGGACLETTKPFWTLPTARASLEDGQEVPTETEGLNFAAKALHHGEKECNLRACTLHVRQLKQKVFHRRDP